jgi:hypothetical protein
MTKACAVRLVPCRNEVAGREWSAQLCQRFPLYVRLERSRRSGTLPWVIHSLRYTLWITLRTRLLSLGELQLQANLPGSSDLVPWRRSLTRRNLYG